MQRKLTITVDEKVYEGLHSVIGRGNISRFLEDLARPYLFMADLEDAYAQMGMDRLREQNAQEWSEGLIADITDAPR